MTIKGKRTSKGVPETARRPSEEPGRALEGVVRALAWRSLKGLIESWVALRGRYKGLAREGGDFERETGNFMP